MEHIKDIFARMDLGKIRHFLLYGEEKLDLSEHPYMDRLKVGSDPILTSLKNLHPDKTEFDKAVTDLSHALTAYESVYFEIGMKAGARLICQLLLTDDQNHIEDK